MTTVRIEIPDQKADALNVAAQARGLTVEQSILQIIEQSAPVLLAESPAPANEAISEIFAELTV